MISWEDDDFNSADPFVRFNAHQAAKGRSPLPDPDVVRKTLKENPPCPDCGRVSCAGRDMTDGKRPPGAPDGATYSLCPNARHGLKDFAAQKIQGPHYYVWEPGTTVELGSDAGYFCRYCGQEKPKDRCECGLPQGNHRC